MTPIEAKKFLVDEFSKYIVPGSVIPGNLDQLFNDRLAPELDDLVHDIYGKSADNAHEADRLSAKTNNDGLDSQLEFMCENLDDETLQEALVDAFHEAFEPDEFTDQVE